MEIPTGCLKLLGVSCLVNFDHPAFCFDMFMMIVRVILSKSKSDLDKSKADLSKRKADRPEQK